MLQTCDLTVVKDSSTKIKVDTEGKFTWWKLCFPRKSQIYIFVERPFKSRTRVGTDGRNPTR
eukprot:328981-Rhodomonas_salina.1